MRWQSPRGDPDAVKVEGDKARLAMEQERHGVEIEARQAEIAHAQAMADFNSGMKQRELSKFEAEQEMKAEEIAQIVKPLIESMKQIGEMVAQTQQAQLQVSQQLIAAITAPRSVTTPEGRTYTSEVGRLN